MSLVEDIRKWEQGLRCEFCGYIENIDSTKPLAQLLLGNIDKHRGEGLERAKSYIITFFSKYCEVCT